jgi:hypothetical protein
MEIFSCFYSFYGMIKNNRYCPIRGEYGEKAELFFLKFAKKSFKEGSLAYHPDGKLNVDFRLVFPDDSFIQFEIEKKTDRRWIEKFPFETVQFLHRRKIRKHCFQIVLNDSHSRFLIYSHDIIKKYKIGKFQGKKDVFLAREIPIKQCKEFSVSDVASFKEFVYNRINKVAPTNKKEIKMTVKTSKLDKINAKNLVESNIKHIALWGMLIKHFKEKNFSKVGPEILKFYTPTDEEDTVISNYIEKSMKATGKAYSPVIFSDNILSIIRKNNFLKFRNDCGIIGKKDGKEDVYFSINKLMDRIANSNDLNEIEKEIKSLAGLNNDAVNRVFKITRGDIVIETSGTNEDIAKVVDLLK